MSFVSTKDLGVSVCLYVPVCLCVTVRIYVRIYARVYVYMPTYQPFEHAKQESDKMSWRDVYYKAVVFSAKCNGVAFRENSYNLSIDFNKYIEY